MTLRNRNYSLLITLPLLLCFGLVGCEKEVAVGLDLDQALAAKGKPVSVVTAGDRTIVRWDDEVAQFDGKYVTRVERRNREREESVRRRCEQAVIAFKAHRAAQAQLAEELRRQAEAENQAYLQNLEAQHRLEETLAQLEDERMRASVFGSVEPVQVQCPRGFGQRLGLAFTPTAYHVSGLPPARVRH